MQESGDYEAAEAYYTRLLDFGAGSREAAKSSLRELRTLQVGGVGDCGQAGLCSMSGSCAGDRRCADPTQA